MGIPVSASVVWVKVNDTDAIRTVFTHEAMGMWAVRDVLGDQGNSDSDIFDILNWSLKLAGRKRERQTVSETKTKNKTVPSTADIMGCVRFQEVIPSCDHKKRV